MPAEGPVRDRREASFHLIETMRHDPAIGFLRIDFHLSRLEHSARNLGFDFNYKLIHAALAALPAATAAQRVRLTYHRDGSASAEAFPFIPVAEGTVWKLRLARQKLNSTDRLLQHKTSRRTAYESARSEFPPSDADEVLMSNEKDEICEGTITTLFADMGSGVLATPALHCGLLAGVLRAQLLADGRAQEAILTLDDLVHARRLFVGNSLRGLIPATLTPHW